MKYKYLLSLFFIGFCKAQTCKLYTFLYNEKKQIRRQEYMTCLEKNLAHPLIDYIHVMYDTSKDENGNIQLLDYLQSLEEEGLITINYIKSRPTFGNFFEHANNEFKNEIIIIANGDIYFNDTLHVLENFDFEKDMVFALTRWDVQRNGALQLFRLALSQDVWIFKAPIDRRFDDNLELGLLHCDGKFAYRTIKAGFRVYNPCLSIQCCHLHLSNIRNYSDVAPDMSQMRAMNPMKLEKIVH